MYNLILACVGFALAIAGGIYLLRLAYLKKFGVPAKAEVMEIREETRRNKPSGAYIHKLRYTVEGRTYEQEDSAGYSKPLKQGSTQIILCDPKDPKKFKFEEDLKSHMTIAAVFIGMALVFAGRFLYTYIK
ncbi:MAG: hypothetical protein IKW96_06540 [Ruminococcus sp.]|uniref:DUF3592 domain-containing protein n=1 Tax=Ruminococcus sp. TaxID=41978 RepID=UPI0025EEB87D|nr:DUF3592 domain-containing protein [Ruminococcus sp.]MBR5682921.1 hypothetical protein [Ruminococcus sp.]